MNANRFSGDAYIEVYDRFRPQAPADLIQQAIKYLGHEKANLVVDLGCGTGLSTLVWESRAQQIIGLEPSADMMNRAIQKIATQHPSIRFAQHFSDDIPLENNSVDIISCSQSFHWMEPVSTLREVNRALTKGGVFVVYDCTWPPAFDWYLEKAYQNLFKRVSQLSNALEGPKATHFKKSAHFKNIEESGYFQYTKEAFYHKKEAGGLERFEGIAMSQGGLQTLLKLGYSREEIGLDQFQYALQSFQGNRDGELTFYYKAIFAKKG